MRTTASLAALVALMAVAGSNGAPIGTPNKSSARSVSRARAQLRSRDTLSLASNVPDMNYTADVPNLKCSDCREKEVKKVSEDVVKSMANVEGDLKDVENTLTSAAVQAPGVPSSSGSVDMDIDIDVNEDPKTGASDRPEEHPNSTSTDNSDSTDNSANDGTPDGANNDGETDESKTNEGKTENGQSDDSGKADPPAEQPPNDESNIDLEDVQDELEKVDRIADDETHDSMNDIESKLSQVNDGAKAALSSTNDDVDELNAEMAKVVTVSQEPGSEKPEDCEDETSVEMRKGNSSVSTSVLRR